MSSSSKADGSADSAKRQLFGDQSGKKIIKSTTTVSGTALTKAVEFKAAVIGGCLLSVNAGCINAITVLESGYTTTHLTGATTNSAINLVKNTNLTQELIYFGIILSYTFGGFITGLLGAEHDNFKLGHQYGRIFLCCFLFLIAALFLEVASPNSYSFIFLCALAAGTQNAMTTKFSGNVLRTTHVSGAFTDIGLILGRIARGRKEVMWKLGLLIPITFSFFCGGCLGGGFYPLLGRYSLVINIAVFGLAFVLYVGYFAYAFQAPLLGVVLGRIEYRAQVEDDEESAIGGYDFSAVQNYSKTSNIRLRDNFNSTDASVL